ncbi:ESF1 homolog [Panulirus ornatus]|uniref:ESF1 homolog n=1 Tax=Panulirus ornatus TaxID=150431 RepID=UPI003A8B5155
MELKNKMKEQKQKEKKNIRKGPGIMKDMNQILSDPRFAHVSSDLKLRNVPKEERKVKLDSRFHSVLTDDKFYEKSIMDPRGRKGNYSTKEDLLKFYHMSSDDDTDDEEDGTDEVEDSDDNAHGKPNEVGEALGVENNVEVRGIVTAERNENKGTIAAQKKESEVSLDKKNREESEVSLDKDNREESEVSLDKDNREESEVSLDKDSRDENENRLRKEKMKEREAKEKLEIPEEVNEQLHDMTQDYARGEMLFSDDSSDDDSTTTEEEDIREFEWGELDQDAIWNDGEHEVEETSRFAVCNLDWDRIKAADIMVLFSSFCRRGACIKKVTIYPSEYGKQRMAEENISGPQELKSKSSHEGDDDINLIDLDKLEQGELDENTGATKAHYEALRHYQRNRLRYYYAVVECDSVDTARIIYQQCDRQSYEGAGFLLDLRYIPSDMSFDETPYDICETVQKSYEVKAFITTALRDSRPVLTWDETDPERKRILSTAMNKALKGEALDDDYLKDLVASSSEDDRSSEDDENINDNEDIKSSQIAKFRALINEIDEKEKKKKERDIDLEEIFHLEEGDTIDEPKPKDKEGTKETAQLNPFEKYLEKRKAKRKEKEKMKKKELNTENGTKQQHELGSAISDDELPEDIDGLYNDPFFAEEVKKMNKAKSNQREGKMKKDSPEDEGAEGNLQENLELMLMNEDDEDKKHFSMREIIEENKEKGKRRKNKKQKKNQVQKQQQPTADDFRVDITDPRFFKLLTSGEYNIDPSHPQFKRTKAMDHLIHSVQMKRIAESFEDIPDAKRQNKSVEKSKDHELSLLVKRVKKKAIKPKKH